MGERYFIVEDITNVKQPIFKGKVKNPELSDIVKFSYFGCFPTQSELEVMGSLRGSALCESALYDTWVENVKVSRGLWGAILGTFATAGLLVAGVASYAIGLIPVAGVAAYFLKTPSKFPPLRTVNHDVSKYRSLDLSKLPPVEDVVEINGIKYGRRFAEGNNLL